ncbi:MAG: hypothetical protein UU67_C0020G0001, partial [Candidatus Daviesbacteria bacterium GW2011_GWB1_41_5]
DGVDRSDVVLGRQGAGRRDRRSRQKQLRRECNVLRLAEVEHGLHVQLLRISTKLTSGRIPKRS